MAEGLEPKFSVKITEIQQKLITQHSEKQSISQGTVLVKLAIGSAMVQSCHRNSFVSVMTVLSLHPVNLESTQRKESELTCKLELLVCNLLTDK